MEQTAKEHTSRKTRAARLPRIERIGIGVGIGLAVVILITGLWSMLHSSTSTFHTRQFKSVFKNFGSIARLALFMVLSHYVLRFIVQKRLVDSWKLIKPWITWLWRLSRRWHVPFAVISLGLIVLHVVGAFLYGFTFDFHNISGLLALSVLVPIPVSGLLRYRSMDRKWHLRLGLTFAVLFLIHAFLSV